MKPKSALRSCLALAGSTLLAISYTHAATITWDGSDLVTPGAQDATGTYTWAPADAKFWNGSADVATTNNTTTDIAQFGNGGTISTSPATINLTTQSINGLFFGATTTNGYTLSASSAGQVLTIGGSGIRMNYGAQATSVGSANLGITLGAAQAWTNNSASLLTIGDAVTNGSNLLTIAGVGSTTISGAIGSGAGGLTKNGIGTLTLSNANTYTGTTTVTAGTLSLTGSLTGSNVSVTGGLINQSAAGSINGAAKTFAHSSALTSILAGTNTYTGTTSITNGILRLNGSLAAGSAVTASGATADVPGGALGGTGTVNGTVTLSGIGGGGINLADGGIGTLSLGQTLSLTSTANRNYLTFDLANAGSTTDKIAVTGAFSMTTSGAGVVRLNQLGGSGNRLTAGTYNILTAASGIDSANFKLDTTKAFGQTFSLSHPDATTLRLTTTQVTGAVAASTTLNVASGSWQTAGNFTGAAIPDYQSNVIINSAVGTTPLNGSTNINSLTFGTSATTAVTISAGTATAGTPSSMLVIEAGAANGNTAGNGITLNNTSGTHIISSRVGLASNQTWTTATGSGLTVSGVISDFGGGYTLTKAGGGTLTLSANNTFSGGMILNAGTLNVTVAQSWGAGGLTVNGGTLTSGSKLENIPVRIMGSADTTAGGTTVAHSAYIDSAATFTLRAVTSGNSATNWTFTNGLSGSGNLQFTGGTSNSPQPKSLTINDSSAFTGNISALYSVNGTTSLLAFSGLGDAGKLIYGGPQQPWQLSYSGSGATFNTRQLEITGGQGINIESSGSGALVFNSNLSVVSSTAAKNLGLGGNWAGGDNAFNGVIANGTATSIGLVKSGNSTWILGGTNTFTGGTSVTAGTLKLNNNLALQNSLLTLSTGTLTFETGITTPTIGGLSGSANLATIFTSGYNNVTALTLNPQTGVSGTYSGIISNGSGAMTLTKTGLGTQILSGPNTYTGNTTVTNGVLNLGVAESVNVSGPLGKQLANAVGTIVLNGGTLQYSAANQFDYSGRFSTAASQQYNVDTNGQNVTWATGLTSSGGTLTKTGAGTLTLSGPNTYTGGTTLTTGTLQFANPTAMSATGLVAVGTGTTLAVNAGAASGEWTNATSGNGSIGGLLAGLGGQLGGTVGYTGNVTLGIDTTNATGGTMTYSGVIGNVGTTLSINKLGTDTLVLDQANTYTGATTISNGTLSLTGSLANTAISTSGSAILNQSAAGVISGTSSFTQGSAATSVLAGTNTYTGATTISNGTLSLTGSLANTAISTSGTGILNQSAAGVISGTSSFTQGSAGTTSVLAGTNTYTGPTTITNGTLQLGSGTGTGSLSTSSAISVGSGATFAVNQSDTVTQGVEFSNAPISGLGNFTQAGPGTTVLNLANTFSGTTTATAGDITLNNALALQNSPLDTTGAGTVTLGLDLCGDPITTLTLGGLTDSGTTRNLADVVTNYNTLNALTLNLGTGSTQTYDGVIGEGATGMDLTKTGAGTQILTGANSYTGTTAIDNGTLTLSGAAGAIASSTAITINRGTLNLTNADNDTEDGLNRIKDDAAITSNGGTLNYTTTTATSTRNFIETIGSVSLATGQLNVVQTLNKTAGSQTLALSGLSQAGTGAITFSNSGGLNLTNDRIRVDGITTDTTAGQIIGAYATLGTTAASQTDYAVYDSDGTDGYIAGANIAASGESAWSTSGNAYTANIGTSGGFSGALTATRTITALKSITAANTVTVDNALDIFTLASNTYANGDAFILGGTAPTGLVSGNTYFVINKSGNTFQLSTTQGGGASLFTTNGTSVTATGAITLSTGNNLETYGLLNSVGSTMYVVRSGTGVLTTPTGGGNLHVTAGVGAITIAAPIADNGLDAVTLVKNGSGTLSLTTSSSFTGGLVLNAGTLNVTTAQGFSGGITINSGDLRPTSNATTLLGSNVVTFAGSGSINTGGVPGTFVIPSVVINSGATATVSAGSGSGTTYTFTDGVSGSGDLVFNGGTTADNTKSLNLNDSSGFTGTVTLALSTSGSAGRAQLNFSALGDGGKIVNNTSTTDLQITYSGAAATGMTYNTRQLEISGSRGTIINSNGTGGLVFNQPLSVVTNTGGKTLTLSGTPSGGAIFNNAFNGQIGNGAGTIALAKTGASIWNVTNAYNSYTGGTIVNGGTLGFANGALGSSGGINASGGTLLWLAGNTQDISSRLAMTAATDSTFHTNGNDVNFASAIGSANTGRLIKTGLGTLTLNGLNTYTGSTTLNAGKLKLNYDTGTGGVNNSKLSNTAGTGTLLLNGGTLELSGGSHVETVLSTTLNIGGTFITQPTGTSTLSMGAIAFNGGAIDFSADSIATTSSGVTNGILSQRATVAGANFAMKSGSNIVAYDYVGANGSTGYTGGAMSANINYAMQTAGGANTLAATTGATSNTLKIANTATGSLTVAGNTLTVGAILFAGSADYDITTSGAGRITPSILHNYGTGGATLTLGALGGALTQFGTGKTILNTAATAAGGLTVNGGIVQIGSNAAIGLPASGAGITLNNGTLLASADIALNNAGANHRAITLGAGGGTLAAANTNTLTVSGVISGAGALTVGTATNTGTVTLSGTNTYSGDTTVSAGTLLVSGSIGASAVTVTGTDTVLATDAAASFGSTVTINNGAILAAGGAAAAGTATVSGGTTFNNDSIFSWDISANGTTYDKVITPTLAGELAAGDAIFRIVLADSTFADSFWSSNQTWTDIFTTDGTSPLTDWASVFGDSVLVVDSSFNPVAGSFTLSCNTLSYSFAAIPEPTTALAGLLLGAGLLRRRR